eukprot:8877014-Pyramimonas_sp.AAC.1
MARSGNPASELHASPCRRGLCENARGSALRPQTTRDIFRNRHPQGNPWKFQSQRLVTALVPGVFRVPIGFTSRAGSGD